MVTDVEAADVIHVVSVPGSSYISRMKQLWFHMYFEINLFPFFLFLLKIIMLFV